MTKHYVGTSEHFTVKIYLEPANMKRPVRLANLKISLVEHLLCVKARRELRAFKHSGQQPGREGPESSGEVRHNGLFELTCAFYCVHAINALQIKNQ